MPITIIIADDHPLCREGFLKILQKPGIKVIGEASNGKELIELTRKLKPEIIITDIKMPVLDGIEATRQLSKEFAEIRIIAMSILDESSLIIDMIEAGAKGYLLKNAHPDEVIDAIHTVYEGQNYYCKEAAAKIQKILAGNDNADIQENYYLHFTQTEKKIIQLICKELSNKEIATYLGITKRTAEWHRHEIMQKINARNTAGVVVYAIKHNIC